MPNTEPTILIVDDNQHNIDFLSIGLTQRGYQVVTSTDSSEAETLAVNKQPDLILLDVMMPGLDGYEVCQNLKINTATRDIPVIFLSAQSRTPDKVKGFSVGAIDYITKPFQAREVLARVELQVALYRATRQLADKNTQLEQEIARRHATEGELKYQTAILEAQKEASPDGILIVSTEREWLNYNQRFIEMWDIPPDIIASGNSPAAIAWMSQHCTNSQAFIDIVEKLYAHPEQTQHDVVTLNDGRVMERYSAPVKGADSTSYGRIWYYRDITDKKLAEDSLTKTNITLQQHLEELKIINQITQMLAHVTNFDVLINTLTKNIARLFSTAATMATLLNREQAHLQIVSYHGHMLHETSLVGTTIPLESNPRTAYWPP
ncbi:MAG: response regulator [Okeania sp. SIO3B3]|nr:response regulator [Okeania sp. SIO3B3]